MSSSPEKSAPNKSSETPPYELNADFPVPAADGRFSQARKVAGRVIGAGLALSGVAGYEATNVEASPAQPSSITQPGSHLDSSRVSFADFVSARGGDKESAQAAKRVLMGVNKETASTKIDPKKYTNGVIQKWWELNSKTEDKPVAFYGFVTCTPQAKPRQYIDPDNTNVDYTHGAKLIFGPTKNTECMMQNPIIHIDSRGQVWFGSTSASPDNSAYVYVSGKEGKAVTAYDYTWIKYDPRYVKLYTFKPGWEKVINQTHYGPKHFIGLGINYSEDKNSGIYKNHMKNPYNDPTWGNFYTINLQPSMPPEGIATYEVDFLRSYVNGDGVTLVDGGKYIPDSKANQIIKQLNLAPYHLPAVNNLRKQLVSAVTSTGYHEGD